MSKENKAEELFNQAFGRQRTARSPAYKAGALAALRFNANGHKPACPHHAGTRHAGPRHP